MIVRASYWGEPLADFRAHYFGPDDEAFGARLSTWAWVGLVPFETDGWVVARWIETNCCATKGKMAGKPLRLRNWQLAEILEIFRLIPGTSIRQYRTGMLGIGRKNGKSTIGAALALQGLDDDEWSPEVYSAAGTKKQAEIVYREAVQMVRMSPQLTQRFEVRESTSEIMNPENNGVYRVVSAEAYSSEGLNIHRCVFDEVHVQPNAALWNVMSLGSGTRERGLTIGFTTAGFNKQTLCGEMYDAGREAQEKLARGEIETLDVYFSWYEAPAKDADGNDIDWRDIENVRLGNPGMGTKEHPDFLLERAVISEQAQGEFAYTRYRGNRWTNALNAWLPQGAWDAAADPHAVPPDTDIAVALDGSFNGDSTALVGCTAGPYLFVIGVWEKPAGDTEWRVKIGDVEDAIRKANTTWQVHENAYDPYRWEGTAQRMQDEGIVMVEFPQSTERLTAATTEFWDALMRDHTLKHDGNPVLARHVGNARTLETPRGTRIVKETKQSPNKIDAAVAAIMAHSRSKFLPTDGEGFNIW